MLDSITETTPMTIADRIRQLRKEHGLTQDGLAAPPTPGASSATATAAGRAR